MFDFAKRSSTVLIITGIAALVFGIVAVIWPAQTAITLVLIWGWYALIDGVLELITAFRPEGRDARFLLIFTGVLGVIAGLIAIFRPIESAVVLTWILGIWLVVRGISELFSAFSKIRTAPRWMLILSAVLFILAGILFIANPGSGAVALSIWLGALAILWGVFILGAGISLRGVSKDAVQV
ncbi:HdeD family acid-resistance protein [Corynebacterium pacaense]|uniref:HdeD family acid-resistance protein n=1 Tax=Corynebacterium pacaense TaxID=1816684 RepID=UPI0009B97D07|nr:HdeD family acid-resistance protein [Corynebacterium pacaense]